MDILLTGATGLIGREVLERLLAQGDTVRVLALPDTVEQVPAHDRVRVVTGGLSDPRALARAAKGAEVIYHLAALLPGNDPRELLEVNVRGTENLLAAGRPRRFVFTSSVSVYSPAPWPAMWPIGEDHPQRAHGNERLRSYGQSKIEAEALIRRAHERHGMEYVILRPPVVYGPGARFVEEILQQLVRNPWRALFNGGRTGPMQWVHATDMADAVLSAGVASAAANESFNVAGAELVTIPRLARTVHEILHPGRRPVHRQPLFNAGHYGLRFDISKAQSRLGYTPMVVLADGLEEMTRDLRIPRQGFADGWRSWT